uniref:DUF6777 domain-containing protein n=1 Tax=Streptomyces sp. TRM64462 TaxID=2741726 RepID=UPI001585E0C4
PAVASLVGVLVAAVALAVVLTRPDEAQAAVSAEPVSYEPPDGFTPNGSRAGAVQQPPPQERHRFAGSAPELYGGSGDRAVCDVELQIRHLTADRAKAEAFASVSPTTPEGIPAYLRGLTPVQLRLDTLVTNHGFRDGKARPYQAVLQAGTAVLIDEFGVPRVRCACGNPLDRPKVDRPERVTGTTWPGFQASQTVVVVPAPTPVPTFTLIDVKTGEQIHRPHKKPATTGTPTPTKSPSPTTSPTDTPTTSEPPTSPGCVTIPPGAPAPATGTPCPVTSPADSPTSPPTDATPEDTPGNGTPGNGTPGGTTDTGTPGETTEAPPADGSPQGQSPVRE